jgi:hypothetical protein
MAHVDKVFLSARWPVPKPGHIRRPNACAVPVWNSVTLRLVPTRKQEYRKYTEVVYSQRLDPWFDKSTIQIRAVSPEIVLFTHHVPTPEMDQHD